MDSVRANTFLAEAQNLDPKTLNINVIGGHSGKTIIPLFSGGPSHGLSQEEIEKLTFRVQFGGDEVVKAKAGSDSATLSMAYAAREFIKPFLEALQGKSGVVLNVLLKMKSGKKLLFLQAQFALALKERSKRCLCPL